MATDGSSSNRAFDAPHSRHVLSVLVVLSIVLHVSAALGLEPLARRFELRAREEAPNVSEVEFEAPPPPPPEPEVAPEPPPPEPEPEPAQPEPRPVVRTSAPTPSAEPATPPPAPAPAPTEAAPVMVVEEEFSNESQDTVATGTNANATGDTTNGGVVRGPGERVTGAQIGGSGNGRGTGPAVAQVVAPTVDLSRRPEPTCDETVVSDEFPQAAMEAGITTMLMRVRVEIDANGRVVAVRPLNNPGYGFVTAAERAVRRGCRFTAARDRSGQPTPFRIESFRVDFTANE